MSSIWKVFLFSICISIWNVCATSQCCDDVSSKCNFLCIDSQSGSFAENILCAVARVKLIACNLKGRVENFMDIIDDIPNTTAQHMEKIWEQVPDDVRSLLSTKQLFAQVSIQQLERLNEELLSHLKTLGGMTQVQFNGILSRLTEFNPDNLDNLLAKVDTSIIFAKISSIGDMHWNKLQLKVLAKNAYKRFGDRIEDWTSSQLGTFGNILAAIPSKNLSMITSIMFNDNLEMLCGVDFSIEQKFELLKPAVELFGNVNGWTSNVIGRLCQFLDGLSAESVKSIDSSEIASAVASLQKYVVQKDVRSVIVEKIKEAWGDVSKWNTQQISKIGTLVNEIGASDIDGMNADQLIQFFKQVSIPILDKVQTDALYEKLRATFTENWPNEIFQKAGVLFKKLSRNDLERMVKDSIMPFLEKSEYAEWSMEQAEFLLEKVKKWRNFPTFSENDIRKLDSILKAFLTSDAFLLSKPLLYKLIPGFSFAVEVGVPVVRYFIKIYKQEAKNGEIKSLGQFAQALTRYDLEREVITDILGNLDALKHFNLEEAQTLELMKKVFQKLGKIDTRQEVGNADSWGSAAIMKQMIGVIHALPRQQLSNYPPNSLASVIEVFGQSDMWERRQVIAVKNQMKKYWDERNMNISDLNELDIEALGKFVQGFTLRELEQIPKEAKLAAFQKLGEYTGLPPDKLKSRARLAYDTIKRISGDVFDSKGVKVMGNLVAGLSADQLKEINPDVLISNLHTFVNIKEMPSKTLRVIVDVVKKSTGTDLSTWTADQWRKLGRAVETLNTHEIKTLGTDSFKLLLDSFGSLTHLTDSQVSALLLKTKETFGEDVSTWSRDVFRKMGHLVSRLSPKDVERINEEVLQNLLSYFGYASYATLQFQKALARRFVEVVLKNNASNLNVNLIKKLGNILVGFENKDLRKINIKTADMLSELGKKKWSSSQVKILVDKALAYIVSSPSNTELYYYLGNIAKGLTTENIKAIPEESFKLAAGVFGKIEGFTEEQRKAFAAKAKEAWGGDVSKWTAAEVSEAGQFTDGLIENDISKIPPENVATIPSNVIARMMKSSKVRSFTENQLLEFTQDQARAVASEQFSSLPPAGITAIQSVINEDDVDVSNDKYSSSGNINSNTYGVTVFVMIFWCSAYIVSK